MSTSPSSDPKRINEEAFRLLGITVPHSKPVEPKKESPAVPAIRLPAKARREKSAPPVSPELEAGWIPLGWPRLSEAKRMGFGEATPAAPQPSITPLYGNDREGHFVTIGPTASGKGVSSLVPIILTYPGSIIVVDVKGEAVNVAARRRKQMGHIVVVLDPFDVTSWPERGSLNPLDVQHLTDEPVEDLAMELPQLLRGENRHGAKSATDGDFWDVRADGLCAGLLAHLLSAPSEATDRTLITLRDILMADDATYLMAQLMDRAQKTMPALAAKQLASFLNTTDVTRSGILATATDRVSALFHPGIERALRTTSFDLAALRDGQPISIFLVIPPGKLKSHGRVLRIWISILMSLLQARKKRPALPTLFLVDEAAQLGAMDQLRSAMTLLRGYGVRTILYFQDLSQLKRLYEDWETLTNNATIQIFGANTQPAAKAAAEITGAAFSADMILNLPSEDGILIQKGQAMRFRKLNYLTDDLFRGLAAPHPMFAKTANRLLEPKKDMPGLAP